MVAMIGAESDSLRILSLNLWGLHAPWPARQRIIRAALAELSPDVVALQEVLRPLGPGTSQADELAEQLHYRVAYTRVRHVEKPFRSEFGNAVLSRYPYREHRSVALPTDEAVEGVQPRGLLYLLLSTPFGLLPLYVTHLDYGAAAASLRQRQVEFVRDYIDAEQRELPGRVPEHVRILPPLLCADLNAPPGAAELLPLSGFGDAAAQLPEASAATVSARNSFVKKDSMYVEQRVDYILYGSAEPAVYEVRAARVCLDQPVDGVYASDHFGVYAELRILSDSR